MSDSCSEMSLVIFGALLTVALTTAVAAVVDARRRVARRKKIAGAIGARLDAQLADLKRVSAGDLAVQSFSVDVEGVSVASSDWPSLFSEDQQSALVAARTEAQTLREKVAYWHNVVAGRGGTGGTAGTEGARQGAVKQAGVCADAFEKARDALAAYRG